MWPPRSGICARGLAGERGSRRRQWSNASDLRDLTQLIGERDTPENTTTRQAGGGRTVSESTRQRAILDPSTIRLIRTGHALLMLRAAKPIMLTLRSWTARVDAKVLKAQRSDVEQALRSGALQRGARQSGTLAHAAPFGEET